MYMYTTYLGMVSSMGGKLPPNCSASPPEIFKMYSTKMEKMPKIDRVYICTRYYNDNLLGFQQCPVYFHKQ